MGKMAEIAAEQDPFEAATNEQYGLDYYAHWAHKAVHDFLEEHEDHVKCGSKPKLDMEKFAIVYQAMKIMEEIAND